MGNPRGNIRINTSVLAHKHHQKVWQVSTTQKGIPSAGATLFLRWKWDLLGENSASVNALEKRSSADDKDPQILSHPMLHSAGDKRLFIVPKLQNKAGAGDT